MGLCETSNFSIFTFSSTTDLKFCTHSHSNCFCLMMRFDGLDGKVCKMMTSNFSPLFIYKPSRYYMDLFCTFSDFSL